jgi:uncharacterized membrane protein YedE/YeeE
MDIITLLKEPWPWYIAGPIIGLFVPLLLIIGNKAFGISSSMRHICAACVPSSIPYFNYQWKKEIWNLCFVLGVCIGGFIAATFLNNGKPIIVHPDLVRELESHGVTDINGLLPLQIFSWQSLWSLKGILFMVVGGFLVGFGTRYAGGCTSGHSIMGLSTLQLPSLIATIFFMIGGFISAWLIVPFLLKL